MGIKNPSPIPNWGDLALRQERPASTSSSHTTLSGFPATSGGVIHNPNRHLRMATAPAASSDENSYFTNARRHRTVSGPPAHSAGSSSHYFYQQPAEEFPHPRSYTDYLNACNASAVASSNSNTLGNHHQSHTHYPFHDASSASFAQHYADPSDPRSPSAVSFPQDNMSSGKPWSQRRSSTSSAVPHSHMTESLPLSSATSYQCSPSSFANRTRKLSGGDSSSALKQRPSFPSTPNRFVSRQLKQGSRDYQSSIDSASNLRRSSRPDPIGVFIWGFPDAVRVKDIIAAFSSFGEMINGKLA